MEVFLVRHGESVDNVAGLLAGVRDAALTVHGTQQAHRLGLHFAQNGIVFTHIFASPLVRALKTAEAIHSSQPGSSKVDIVRSADLIERDFGSDEGKSFRSRGSKDSPGKARDQRQSTGDSRVDDGETRQSIDARADRVLDVLLLPPLKAKNAQERLVVVIVSHGILLSHLWRRLLHRMPANSVAVDPVVAAHNEGLVLQRIGNWSNTGYLHLILTQSKDSVAVETITDNVRSSTVQTGSVPTESIPAEMPTTHVESSQPTATYDVKFSDYSILIKAIDGKDHLVGLKRQRGGIGRSAHDKRQKRLDGYFTAR